MTTIYISNSIKNATSLDCVVEIINEAANGHCEGMEGVEFTPDQLAGQWGFDAADDAGYGITEENVAGQLEFLADSGAKFDAAESVKHAMLIASAHAE